MSRRSRRLDQRGLAAIMISLMMVALMIIAGMVVDFGMVRYNRQINKSVADTAVAAGMRSFDAGDGQVYTFRGVCDTLGYLKANAPDLASLPAYAPCSSVPTLAKTCRSVDTSTFAAYSGQTSNGRYQVTIKAPYTLPEASFPEDAIAATSGDNGIPCMQLGVVITQKQKTGFSSVAGASDINTTIRSVGRVKDGPGTRSPALLLLERHECLVLTTGTNTNSANQDNFIRVFGAQAGAAVQPGTIHADSDGSACGSNETIFQGKRLDGIVAYAAPDFSEHGIISSFAKQLGVANAIISDGFDRTYGSDALDFASSMSAPKYPVSPLGLITRKIVDDRYLAGLRVKVQAAESLFNLLSSTSAATAQGFSILSACTGANQAAINALTGTKVYVDCAGYRGTGTFNNATEIFFRGTIDQQATTLLPKATRVWIRGSSSNAINSTGNPFRMHYNGNASCPNTVQAESALLIVRNGRINNNNGHFQACNTAVIMMSGDAWACLPVLGTVVPPTNRPCGAAPGNAGTGQLDLGGGGSGSTQIDWTAPNMYDQDLTLLTEAQKQASWDNLEDLAFWSESWGDGVFKMSGGSGLHLVGVFMTPNADPFVVTGGGAQTLTNAQYIATKFEVNGGASLNMVVDPNNTVTLPQLTYFNLVR